MVIFKVLWIANTWSHQRWCLNSICVDHGPYWKEGVVSTEHGDGLGRMTYPELSASDDANYFSSESYTNAAFPSWSSSPQNHNQIIIVYSLHSLQYSLKTAGTDKDQGDMSICKSTQEEIKAGFLVVVSRRLPVRQMGKGRWKGSIQRNLHTGMLISRVSICTLWKLSAWRNERPLGEGRCELTFENQGWQHRFLCLWDRLLFLQCRGWWMKAKGWRQWPWREDSGLETIASVKIDGRLKRDWGTRNKVCDRTDTRLRKRTRV